jgi:hypothetical protein
MYIRYNNGVPEYFSSFCPRQIRLDHYVVTVFSGSSYVGGHASIFLEHFGRNGAGQETLIIDLRITAGAMRVNTETCQYAGSGPNGQREMIDTLPLPKGGDIDLIAGTNHRCYDASTFQRDALLRAVDRFSNKMGNGRYSYAATGGVLGWIGSLPGQRGINCADFIIKVLNEAKIANRKYGLVDLPSRIARSR